MKTTKLAPCLGVALLRSRVVPALIAGLNLIPAASVKAQTSINGDGAYPFAGLSLSGNTLYGTAQGGSSGYGTVFKLNTDGTAFTNLHSFTASDPNSSGGHTNSDGIGPAPGLTLSGNTLYGTAAQGGSSGYGTVFAVNTDGTGFTNLHSFTATPSASPSTNSDGANPYAGLILSGSTLYGTAAKGGSSGNGTVFAVNTNGTGFTTLHSFTTLLVPLPQLTIYLSGTNVFLMWPTNFDRPNFTYRLQSTTSLVPSTVWTSVSPAPVVVNGQKIVANPITGTQQFYRLSPQPGGGGPGPGCTSDTDCGPGYACIDGSCVNRQ